MFAFQSGFFNQLGRDLKYVGKEVTRGIDDAAKSADKTLNEHWSSPLLVSNLVWAAMDGLNELLLIGHGSMHDCSNSSNTKY